MALTLDSTVAGTGSNSYADVSFCDDYWAQHFSTAKAAQWSALSSTKKAYLLIQACRVLETLKCSNPVRSAAGNLRWVKRPDGKLYELRSNNRADRYSVTQLLQFPRAVDIEPDTGDPFVPEGVKMAQCEQAVYLLNFDESALSSAAQGIESESVDAGGVSVSQNFKSGGSSISPIALDFMKPFLITGSRWRRA